MTKKVNCDVCENTGWVCEKHPDKAWSGITGKEECCGGAGMPCKCNKASPAWKFEHGNGD